MKIYDFEYDNMMLSDFGFVICKFDSSGIDTVSNGAELSFNTIASQYGAKYELTSVNYNDPLTATFQICKNVCTSPVEEVTVEEARTIMRWLNRKGFHKFRFINDEYIGIYFKASFNVRRVEVGGILYGFELDMTTNAPFAFHEPIKINIINSLENGKHVVVSESDEEGYIYPRTEIEVKSDGDLTIYNELEDRTTFIKNCKQGEIIKFDYPVIETSLASHEIQNDFNWTFFRIAKQFRESANNLTISLPCDIKIEYSPVVKLGLV